MPEDFKKVALITSGCKANQYDTAVLENRFRQASLEIVDFTEKADFYVINSCAITAEGEADARNFARRAKRANPDGVILVTGCAAQVSAASFEKMEEVDHVIGNVSKEEIVRIVAGAVPEPPLHQSIFFGGGVRLFGHTRAFLKIQDGCSQFCSFCIVPFARGLNRSVPEEEVLSSLHTLGKAGVPEVVLTGIHLGTYGKDLRSSFEGLLERIAREKPVPRIRISSLDPEEVTDGMIRLMAEEAIFCPHFHLPLQSGDDGILKKMRRRYTGALFFELCEKIRRNLPDAAIGTDAIVGFPGEGEGEFSATLDLVQRSGLSYLHVFPYSVRVGTRAASFDGEVEVGSKRARSKILREISDAMRKRFHERFIGRDFQVVLQKQKGGTVGLTGNYIPIGISSAEGGPSGMTRARIVSVSSDGVKGEVIH